MSIKLLQSIIFTAMLGGCASAPAPLTLTFVNSYESCVAAGGKMLKTFPPRCVTSEGFIYTAPEQKGEAAQGCVNNCGDGQCAEMVCMAIGCPCAETAATCPQDCPAPSSERAEQ